MKIFFTALVAVLIFAVSANANNYKADIFAMGSKKSQKLFMVTNVMKDIESGLTEALTTYSDLAGQPAWISQTQLKGIEIQKISIQQKQLGIEAEVKIDAENIEFSLKQNGKEKKDTEKRKGDLVFTSNFQKYVASKWSDIAAGKTVSIRWIAWDRLETVGFELKKVKTEMIDGAEQVVVVMKPSSFIIAAIVKPITFWFPQDGSRLLSLSGRVPPKLKSGDSWQDLDADVYYTYEDKVK